MTGLIKHKVWERVLRSTLLSSDTIFQTRFHYKIKSKGGKLNKCKVRLVVRGDHMTKKDESDTGDFEDAFSSHTLVVSAYFSLSLLNTICIPIT